jgi:dihydropyrimidinase
MEDLAIKNGLIMTPNATIMGGLTVKSGKITYIGCDTSLPKANSVVDAAGKYVLPGLIDPHGHQGMHEENGPSGAFGGEMRTESAAAAIGGITTIITTTTAPRFNPKQPRIEIQKRDKEVGSQNSFIDFKITQQILTDEHVAEIPGLFEEGCTSFKFVSLYGEDWGTTYKGYKEIGRLGRHGIAMQHAEQIQIINKLRKELIDKGRNDLKAHFESRPAITESIDVATAGLISLKTGCTFYVVHVSAKQTVEIIKFLRQIGARVFAETCPHYLARTADEDLDIGAKVMPALRDETHIDSLWKAIDNGVLDTIGQDSMLGYLKERIDAGVWEAKSGWPGMGAMLPVMMTYGVHKGRITMNQLVKITSENSAKIFSVYPQKGVLSQGSDADIIIFDPHKEWTLDVKTLKTGSDFTPWEGTKVKGKVIKTFLRGKLIAEDGHLVSETPTGEFLEPIIL